ncbi:MAG TPA: ABC transporter permease, partial [Rhodopila sp.]
MAATAIETMDAAPATPPPARTNDFLRRLMATGRPVLLGAISLSLFLLAWDLLTTYRVEAIVRFTNIPTPGSVLARAARAFVDPEFQYNIVVSCRRIALGFVVATAVGVPAGMLMGRWRLAREAMLPVFEVLRPIPAIAWVPLSIMLWPTNEQSIV